MISQNILNLLGRNRPDYVDKHIQDIEEAIMALTAEIEDIKEKLEGRAK